MRDIQDTVDLSFSGLEGLWDVAVLQANFLQVALSLLAVGVDQGIFIKNESSLQVGKRDAGLACEHFTSGRGREEAC